MREVQLAEPAGFPSPVELTFQPLVADELLVLLEDRQVIRVVNTGMQVQPDQRVHVVADRQGARA